MTTIAFRDFASFNQGVGTSITVDTTAVGAQAGDVLVAAVAVNAPSSVDNPITAPTGWTFQAGAVDISNPGIRVNLYTRAFAGGNTHQFDYTTSTSACAIVAAYSDVDTTNPVAASEAAADVQGTGSTTRTTPSITTAADRWIVSAFADRSGSTWTPADTERAERTHLSSTSVVLADSNGDVAAATLNRTATASVSSSTAAQAILALQAASAASPTEQAIAHAAETDAAQAITASTTTPDPQFIVSLGFES